MNKEGKLFVISGPSGVGKSTVIRQLFQTRENLYFSISSTTREPREGETNGRDYNFVSHQEFLDMITRNELLEYAEYVGNYYGTSAEQVKTQQELGKDVVLDIEVQGAFQVKAKRSDAVLIFLAPPSMEELEERLRHRGTDSPEKIAKRLVKAREEYARSPEYDYIVVNDQVSHAAACIDAIMTAEHCKNDRGGKTV